MVARGKQTLCMGVFNDSREALVKPFSSCSGDNYTLANDSQPFGRPFDGWLGAVAESGGTVCTNDHAVATQDPDNCDHMCWNTLFSCISGYAL